MRAINTIIGIVKKDTTVDTTIVLAILLTTLFEEYIDPTKYVSIALGMEHWISKTPAGTPFKSNKKINPKATKGPKNNLANVEIIAFLKEKTVNFVSAIPKDININAIVE